ncbi:MAG: HD domain-containing protein, partial [Candidatus Aenigmatarchaeota archaeon]
MIVTDERLREIMTFFHEVGNLQEVKRRGFAVCGVKDAQSSAEHSFRFSVMAMILGKGRNIDVNKAIKMGLIHDLAEVRIGDIIVWLDYDMKETDKLRKEREELHDMIKNLGQEGKEIIALWDEFENGKTSEAQFAREIDKLEMVFQTFEYEKDG